MNDSFCRRCLKAENQVTDISSDYWALIESHENRTTRLPSVFRNDKVKLQTVPRGSTCKVDRIKAVSCKVIVY